LNFIQRYFFCDNGTYEGKMRIKDSKTDAIYTLNLTVIVDFPPEEGKEE
jgi:hypothetical protein